MILEQVTSHDPFTTAFFVTQLQAGRGSPIIIDASLNRLVNASYVLETDASYNFITDSIDITNLYPGRTYQLSVVVRTLDVAIQKMVYETITKIFTLPEPVHTMTLDMVGWVYAGMNWNTYDGAYSTLYVSSDPLFSASTQVYDGLDNQFFSINLKTLTQYYYRATITYPNGYTTTTNILSVLTPLCFLADAPILTPYGYVPIREIKVGDKVLTAEKRVVSVKRVFSRLYSPSHLVNPLVIPKGFLGATRPVAISPNHEVLVPGRGMVKARDLGLRRMKMSEDFVYYNLELEDWVRDNLVVAGVVCESLAPAARVTMTKAEFMRFVNARYGPTAASRLRSVCVEEKNGMISLPAI